MIHDTSNITIRIVLQLILIMFTVLQEIEGKLFIGYSNAINNIITA